jgi:HEAT repeat protein
VYKTAGLILLIAIAATVAPASDVERLRALEVVNRVKDEARNIPKQAEALVRLAWLDDRVDAHVRALAREQLVEFGKHSTEALHSVLPTVDPVWSADITLTLIESRRRLEGSGPHDFIAALEQAIWFGSVDARRLAIREIERFSYKPAMLPIVDAAIEHPELAAVAIRCLGKLGDDRARHYLGEQLSASDPALRILAAEALAATGGRAVETLREATLSNDAVVRHAAMLALLPRTSLNDLTILHEYVYLHPEDDPEILQKVRDRAILLESLMEDGLDHDAVNPVPE